MPVKEKRCGRLGIDWSEALAPECQVPWREDARSEMRHPEKPGNDGSKP